MKINFINSSKRNNMKSLKSLLTSLFILLIIPVINGQNINLGEQVLNAFDLRIGGSPEKAKEVLNNVINIDSTYALAHFEYSRLDQENALQHLEKAVYYDADNPMYGFQLANAHMLKAYISFKQGKEELGNKGMDRCIAELERVLTIKGDCKESLLFLIDLHSIQEGDENRSKAIDYMTKLKKVDPLYGLRAELLLAGNSKDPFSIIDEFITNNGSSDAILEFKGMLHMNMGDLENAQKIFVSLIEKDIEKSYLFLQIARGHLYRAMQASEKDLPQEMDKMSTNIGKYLESNCYKEKAVEAWSYGWLSVIERKRGNEEKAKEYVDKANSIYPNFSRATALPSTDKELPPDQVAYKFRSYFSPF